MAIIDLRTKQCPFCAESIQAEAVKCRFCGEFLNTDRVRALESACESDCNPSEQEATNDKVLFAGKPSLWGLVPAVFKGLLFFIIAGLLIKIPLEKLLGLELTVEQAELFAGIRVLIGAGLGAVVVLILALKVMNLKMVYYEVMPSRIEWSRGILDRRIDNLDMFRVIDLKLRRSALDCIFGVGTVVLTTTDKSDPEFAFKKIRNSRKLYDVIKKASLESDRRSSVVHLE